MKWIWDRTGRRGRRRSDILLVASCLDAGSVNFRLPNQLINTIVTVYLSVPMRQAVYSCGWLQTLKIQQVDPTFNISTTSSLCHPA